MKFYSTNHISETVDFQTAVVQGLPQDKGLFFPSEIPTLPKSFFDELKNMSFHDLAFQVAKPFVKENLNDQQLTTIINHTLSFDIPLVRLSDSLAILELFHGPTLAFKDVGARFLAGCLSQFAQKNDKKVTILVATSGDTGSAVANAFLGLEGVEVFVLYPEGKVSELQEKQMTTLGQNITALKVKGTFDDCQRMVKQAFVDDDLNQKLQLTSANSINMARLLPQSFYYFHAFQQLDNWEDVTMIIPSGNLGNSCAGMLAQSMDLPISRFVMAHNANNTYPQYVSTGNYQAKPSVKTISNAMDVGDPSNFVRIRELQDAFGQQFSAQIEAYSYDDNQTRAMIKQGFADYNYTFDPHGAVGLAAFNENDYSNAVVIETAHPAKFLEVVEESLNTKVEIPASLSASIDKASLSISMENDFEAFKAFLLQ